MKHQVSLPPAVIYSDPTRLTWKKPGPRLLEQTQILVFVFQLLSTAQLIRSARRGCPTPYFSQPIHGHRHTGWAPGEDGGHCILAEWQGSSTRSASGLFPTLSPDQESSTYRRARCGSCHESENTVHLVPGSGECLTKHTNNSVCVLAMTTEQLQFLKEKPRSIWRGWWDKRPMKTETSPVQCREKRYGH